MGPNLCISHSHRLAVGIRPSAPPPSWSSHASVGCAYDQCLTPRSLGPVGRDTGQLHMKWATCGTTPQSQLLQSKVKISRPLPPDALSPLDFLLEDPRGLWGQAAMRRP